jgi:hypothetical protein
VVLVRGSKAGSWMSYFRPAQLPWVSWTGLCRAGWVNLREFNFKKKVWAFIENGPVSGQKCPLVAFLGLIGGAKRS